MDYRFSLNNISNKSWCNFVKRTLQLMQSIPITLAYHQNFGNAMLLFAIESMRPRAVMLMKP